MQTKLVCSRTTDQLAETNSIVVDRDHFSHVGDADDEEALEASGFVDAAEEGVAGGVFVVAFRGDDGHLAHVQTQRKLLVEQRFDKLASTAGPVELRRDGAEPVLAVVNFWREVQSDPAILLAVDLHVQDALRVRVALRFSIGRRLEADFRLKLGQVDRQVATRCQSDSATDEVTFVVDRFGTFGRHFQKLFDCSRRVRAGMPNSPAVFTKSAADVCGHAGNLVDLLPQRISQ